MERALTCGPCLRARHARVGTNPSPPRPPRRLLGENIYACFFPESMAHGPLSCSWHPSRPRGGRPETCRETVGDLSSDCAESSVLLSPGPHGAHWTYAHFARPPVRRSKLNKSYTRTKETIPGLGRPVRLHRLTRRMMGSRLRGRHGLVGQEVTSRSAPRRSIPCGHPDVSATMAHGLGIRACPLSALPSQRPRRRDRWHRRRPLLNSPPTQKKKK